MFGRTRVPAPRVLLIGIDGADPLILEQMIAAGRLPTFARLKKEGAYGPLESREPLLSPLVWTTIATGRKPQEHGILDFVEVAHDGSAVPITSARRKVPSLWNILTEFERPSGFIGWYASYPAEKTLGFQVSDRMAFHQVKSARATEHATFPAALAADLREALGEPTPDVESARRRFLAKPEAPLSADGLKRLTDLAKIQATTEFYRAAAWRLQRSHAPQVLGVYFELVDACGHLFMEDAPPRRPQVAELDYAAFSETVSRCYEYQDEVLSDLLKMAGPETTTLVVSDHGFKSGEQRPHTSGRADVGLAPLWHRIHGVVFVHGAQARAGAAITKVGVLDVTPTVLKILGVPLSAELTGAPMADALSDDVRVPGRTVPRYAPPPPPPALADVPADPETIEKLKALGYLGGTEGKRAAGDDRRTATSYVNEAAARAGDGDVDGAFGAYAKALRLEPDNVNALIYSAKLLLNTGDVDRARELLDRAARAQPDNPIVHLQRAHLLIRTGAWDEAADELAKVERADSRLAHLHLLKARLHHAQGRTVEALADTDRARALTDSPGMLAEILVLRATVAAELQQPGEAARALAEAEPLASAPPWRVRGDVAMARRDFKAAAAAYQKALEERGDDALLLRKHGQALAGAGQLPEAEKALRQSLARASSDAQREGAYGDLSLVLQMAGRPEREIALLEEATRALSRSAGMWGVLGAAYGRAGQKERAIAAYERSVALRPTPLGCKTLGVLIMDRDRARAVRLFRQSLALDPNQPDVRGLLEKHGAPPAQSSR